MQLYTHVTKKKAQGKAFQKHSCWSNTILTDVPGSLTPARAEADQQRVILQSPP